MAIAAIAAAVVLVTLALIVAPLWRVLRSDGAPIVPDPASCRVCYLALLCGPALECALGVVALSVGLNLIAFPDIFEHATGAFVQAVRAIATQTVWAGIMLTLAAMHFASLLWDAAPFRISALLLSATGWMFLAITAWPLRAQGMAFGHYSALAAISVLALWGFALERGRASA